MNAGHGLLTHAEALDLGMSPSEIRRLIRQQTWIAVRRGVYTTAEHWESLDPYAGRRRLVARAAVRSMRRGWVLSHTSAADELGMQVLRPPDDPITHITRPGWTNAWTEHGVAHHLARFEEHQRIIRNDLPVLEPARTAVDIAREYGVRAGVVACDSALRLGITHSALVAAYQPMAHWPGVRSAYTAVDLSDGGAANANESLGRELVHEAGLGHPVCQFPFLTEEGVFFGDIMVGNHVIEVDSRLKLRSVDRGGVKADVEDALWQAKRRERLIVAQGTVLSTVIWEDYWGAQRSRAIRRLQAAQREADERFGSRTQPHLLERAERVRSEYAARGIAR
ncbi:hypothetical protein GCM10027076_08160 [Nocardioides montaniterrae]